MKRNVAIWLSVFIALGFMMISYRYVGYERDGLAVLIFVLTGGYITAFFSVNLDHFIKWSLGERIHRSRTFGQENCDSRKMIDFNLKAFWK